MSQNVQGMWCFPESFSEGFFGEKNVRPSTPAYHHHSTITTLPPPHYHHTTTTTLASHYHHHTGITTLPPPHYHHHTTITTLPSQLHRTTITTLPSPQYHLSCIASVRCLFNSLLFLRLGWVSLRLARCTPLRGSCVLERSRCALSHILDLTRAPSAGIVLVAALLLCVLCRSAPAVRFRTSWN